MGLLRIIVSGCNRDKKAYCHVRTCAYSQQHIYLSIRLSTRFHQTIPSSIYVSILSFLSLPIFPSTEMLVYLFLANTSSKFRKNYRNHKSSIFSDHFYIFFQNVQLINSQVQPNMQISSSFTLTRTLLALIGFL